MRPVAAVPGLPPGDELRLGMCRSSVAGWRRARHGGLAVGVRHAAWCFGCLIVFEKTLPRRRIATTGTAAALLLLAIAAMAAPDQLPGLVTPAHDAMPAMGAMH